MSAITDSKAYVRADLVAGLSIQAGLSESKSRQVIDHLIEQITLALLSGQTVYLPKLGKFSCKLNGTRRCVHPLSLEPWLVPPSVKVKYTPSSTLTKLAKKHVDEFEERKLASLDLVERQAYLDKKESVTKDVAAAKESFNAK